MVGRVFLGRYEAVRLLGEGGMGRVYLARQRDLGRNVVVKVMHERVALDLKFQERFQRETLLMARFQHPYAVTLLDASLDDPQGPCIIMEYVKGITLDTLLSRNGTLSPPRVGRLLGQLCEVLQAAHAEGIIHRDLKPGNLMVVDSDTPYEKLKVMDFGLATLIGPQHDMRVTEANAEFAIGSPAYMCPEQACGEEIDQRGDLYSVGVILYELLTGRLPFAGRSTMDMLLAHATEAAPSLTGSGSDWLTPAIDEVVQSCLAKNPDQRPTSARDLAMLYEAAVQAECPPAEIPDTKVSTDSATFTAPALEAYTDPSAIVHELEAWMPEQIAAYKLRGFVNDVGGEVLESVRGLIRVRLGGPGTPYELRSRSALAWLGFGNRRGSVLEVELHLRRSEAGRENRLRITVVMRASNKELAMDPIWRDRCERIYMDLRGYLIAEGAPSESIH